MCPKMTKKIKGHPKHDFTVIKLYLKVLGTLFSGYPKLPKTFIFPIIEYETKPNFRFIAI